MEIIPPPSFSNFHRSPTTPQPLNKNQTVTAFFVLIITRFLRQKTLNAQLSYVNGPSRYPMQRRLLVLGLTGLDQCFMWTNVIKTVPLSGGRCRGQSYSCYHKMSREESSASLLHW